MKTKLYFLFPILFVVVFSCRKNDVISPKANDRIKDSTIDYARDIYLWYSQIPSSFDEQAYTDPNEIMKGIRPYSKEPGFPDPVDRWSFAIKQQEWDNISAGIARDFGLNVFFKQEGDLRVRLVEKESPAGLANIRRGWRITKINGSSNITTSNAAAISAAIYNSSQVSLTFQKPDGGFADISLSAASYREHPILLDSVYAIGGVKAGYMVYNSFLGDSLETVSEFQRVFNRFGSEGVNDVIVDLRYNGGGYVFYQQVLANYLVSNAADGQLMMSTGYNDKYSSNNRSVNFSKKGALDLPRIFFIVSSNTASASELLINNLKPYMNVFLVGPSHTYGKPVGYFNIPVGDWYIFPVSSRTTNKNGEGNYFNGFDLNSMVADGIDKDWGDTNETCLASALRYIGTGAFRRRTPAEDKTDPAMEAVNAKLDPGSFKGMVFSK